MYVFRHAVPHPSWKGPFGCHISLSGRLITSKFTWLHACRYIWFNPCAKWMSFRTNGLSDFWRGLASWRLRHRASPRYIEANEMLEQIQESARRCGRRRFVNVLVNKSRQRVKYSFYIRFMKSMEKKRSQILRGIVSHTHLKQTSVPPHEFRPGFCCIACGSIKRRRWRERIIVMFIATTKFDRYS